MGKSQHTIDINANIKTQLQGMDKVVREFQNGLSNGMSKIDMTKGVGKDLSKLISKFENDFSKINSLISLDNKISLGDSKEFQKYGDSIISVFRDIQRVANDLGQKGLIDAKKLFPEAFDSKVSEMLSQLGRLKSSFIELAQKEASVVKLQGEINDLTSKIAELKTASDNFDSLKQNFEEATQQAEEATKNVEALKKSIIGLAQKKLLDDDSLEDTEKAAKALREELEKLKTKGVTTGKSGHATFNGKNMTEWRAIEKEGTDSQKQQAKEVIELLKEYNLLNNELRTHNRLLEENARLKQLLDNGGPSNKKDVQDLAKIVGEKDAVKEAYTKQAEAADKAAAAQEELNKAEGAAEQTVGLAKKLDEKNQKLRETEAAIKALKTATDFSQIAAELNKIEGIKVDESMLKSAEGLARVVKQLEGLDEKAYSELKETLQSLGITLPDATQNVKEFGGSLEEAGDKAKELDDNLSEMKALKSRITQFFGLTNAINLFKRTVSNAINSVKELDAVMTETAVVTDFSVGDMWEKLPEYASHASDLGASIRDVYAATTLYYQQGLKTNEAMSVGVETMKMARIANIEAGDATQYMTAALRGFNMEVNEMNAERVNDVYSELAAITAADTAQIATAMSKTASIAASANMEFETTAALLAQIIETTQEAPETAGTAMKTIIARFAEVKKLREEGQETGEDEEGEIIDVNKIQGALREVGISMDEFFAGTEGLDSILLKLAEKWSDLDFETQRYIATTAAGSRQQSRFIAMMSDYGRTMELAAAANNSAGASQKQFDKTLESLDAKVQKLNAAWQEFTMGLANSEIIKFGVDILTFLLNTINKVINALSGENGIAKSIITLNLAVAAIGGIRAALGKLFDSKLLKTIGSAFTQISDESQKTGITAGDNISKGVKSGLDQAVQDSVTAGQQIAQNLSGPSENLRFSQQELFIGPPLPPPEQQEKPGGTEGDSGNKQGGTVDTSSILEKNAKSAQNAKKANIALTGTLITLTGTALNWGSTALKTNEDTESLGHAMQGMGTAASAAGSAMTMLAPIIAKTSLSLGALSIYAVAIIALVGALVYAFKEIEKASPEGKLKAAQESAQEAAQAADAAAESYNNLASSLESIEGKETALEELTVGTQEWRDAVAELNNEILDLIGLYPELSDYVTFENGVLKISEEGKQKVTEKQNQIVQNTQSAKIGSQIEVQKAQQKVSYSNLDSDLKVIKGTRLVPIEDDPGVSNSFLQRQKEEYGAPSYTSTAAFPNQVPAQQTPEVYTTIVEYDEEKTNELAKKYARGDFDPNTAFEEGGELAGFNDEQLAELKAYGQELINAEGAIRVFSDSLLNNAIVNGEIDQKYNDAMMNFIDADTIDKKITERAAEIDPENEEVRQNYAKSMGYQYEDGKFYSGQGENKKEVTVTKQDIKTQTAAIQVTEELTGKMEQLEGFVGGLSEKTDTASKAFVNIATSKDGQGLTTKDLEENPNATSMASFLWLENEEALTGIYGDWLTFLGYVQENFDAAKQQNETNKEKLSNFGAENIFDNVELSTGAATKITDKLYDTFIISGEGAANELSTSLQKIFDESEMSPEEAENFAKALTEIDWSSIDSVEELDKIMADYGVTNTKAIDSIEELEDKIIKASKASKNFDLDKLREELKKSEDLVKDIKGREDNERTFTKEQRDLMVEANPELEDQFVMTGLDEFTFIGDSMDSLVAALNDNTNAIIGKTGEELSNKAAQSQNWVNAMNNQTQVGDMWNQLDFSEALQKVLNGEALSDTVLQRMLGAINADSTGLSNEQMVEKVKQLYERDYGVGGEIAQKNIEDNKTWQENETQLSYNNKDSVGLQYRIQNETTERNGEKKVSEKPLDASSQEKYIKALQTQAVQAGVNKTKIEEFNKALKKNKGQLDDNTAAILTNAIADKKATEQLTKTMKNVGKITDKYEDLKDITDEDVQNIGEQFGLEDLQKDSKNFDFIKDNLKLIQKGINGDVASMQKFHDLLAKQMNVKVNATTGFVDMSKITEASVEVKNSTMEAINALLKAGAFELETVKVDKSGEYEVPIIDEATGLISGFEKKYFDEGQTYQVIKPVDAPQIKDANVGAGRAGKSKTPKKSGGGKTKKEKWENPYDKQYNTVQKINVELRKREKLEKRYQNLIAKSGTTPEELRKNQEKQIASVKAEMKNRQKLLDKRKDEMENLEKKNKKYKKYAYYDEKEGRVVINWKEINKIKDPEKGKKVEDYIKKLEEKDDQIKEQEDALDEQTEILRQIYEQGRDEYLDLEDRVKDALIGERQKEIDKLSAINDSINDTNTRLISAMQASIDKYRQDRENARTEEELSDKQRRLAYLRQDTSGANALEIMQLEKELEQGQEDYTDTLVDQKISELQQQNDEAAEQRERQIQIAQEQLDKWSESGEIWKEVNRLMTEGIDINKGLIKGSELEKILRDWDNFSGLSGIGQMQWLEELENQVAMAVAWLTNGATVKGMVESGMLKKDTEIDFTTADGKSVKGRVQKDGTVKTDTGEVYKNVRLGYDGKWVTEESYIEPKKNKKTQTTEEKKDTPKKEIKVGGKINAKGAKIYGYIGGEGYTQHFKDDPIYKVLDEKNGYLKVRWHKRTSGVAGWFKKSDVKAYKQGGLADFTGPAWLDGTKSKPEYILNAEQTKSFFELVDVLGSLKGGINQNSQITGDSIYDVDINVESIGSDYDVEQLASTVKRMIVDDARYRNNNVINLSR